MTVSEVSLSTIELGRPTVSVLGRDVYISSEGSPSMSRVRVVQRFTPSRGERDTNGSFWRACASPAVVTLSSYTSRKYSSSKYRPAAGKSNREDPTLVTAPPPGACRKASPIEGKSMAFEVQLEAYRLTRRLPLVSDSASSLLMLLSPHDMTLR